MSSDQTVKTEQDQLLSAADNPAATLPWPNNPEQQTISPVFYQPQPSPPVAPAQSSPTEHVHRDKHAAGTDPQQPQTIVLHDSLEKPPNPADPANVNVPVSVTTTEADPTTLPASGPDASPDSAGAQSTLATATLSNPVASPSPTSPAVLTVSNTSVPATLATSATATPVVSAPTMPVVSAPISTPMSTPASAPTLTPLVSAAAPTLAPAPQTVAPPVAPTVATAVAPAVGAPSFTHPGANTHPSIHPQPGQPMDLHENGNLLGQFAAPTADAMDAGIPQSVGQTTAAAAVVQANAVLAPSIAPQIMTGPVSQGMALHVTQNGAQAIPQTSPNHTVRVVTSAGLADGLPTPGQTAPIVELPKEIPIRKTARLPGTKQCPSCQATIAAAVASCPKCAHVFRQKKEKPKRSGKRGKKNCPKCGFENPSACSSCKQCKHVFRLKLMDRYKQMRPRPTTSDATAVAAVQAATVAVAAAVSPPAIPAPAPTASATVPNLSGVQQYHPQMTPTSHLSQAMHPPPTVSVSGAATIPSMMSLHNAPVPHVLHAANLQNPSAKELHPHSNHPHL